MVLNMHRLFILTLCLLLAPLCRALEATRFEWPDGAVAAVSLAYDDALDSQLDHAIRDLDAHGFKGTFYLNLSSDTLEHRQAEWRAAAANGHELGNHTLFHPCSMNGPDRDWVVPWHDLDRIPAEAMVERVRLANLMLTALDGRHERTFTPPCGDLRAGGVNYVEQVRPMFVAIKGCCGPVGDMGRLDPHLVPVYAPVDMDGAELIALVEEAGRLGTMVNLTFHGIGGDYLSVSREAHAELLQYLAEHRERYWTDTFLAIMKHVREHQP